MSFLSPYTHHLRMQQDNTAGQFRSRPSPDTSRTDKHAYSSSHALQDYRLQQTDLRPSPLSSCILTSEDKDQDHTQMIPYNSKTLSHSKYQLSMLITISGNQRRPERSESSKFSLSVSMTKYKLCKALQNEIKRKSKTS